MIKHISINNFAVIKNADIDLYEGLNIITGETGAGKLRLDRKSVV